MAESEGPDMGNVSHIKNWDTYKILNRLRENIHKKQKLARQR